MEKKGIIIQEPLLLEETEKILNAFYEYKSKEGILVCLLGNLNIKDIKIPNEIKESEKFEEHLVSAINEAILEVNKCTQQELQDILLNNMEE